MSIPKNNTKCLLDLIEYLQDSRHIMDHVSLLMLMENRNFTVKVAAFVANIMAWILLIALQIVEIKEDMVKMEFIVNFFLVLIIVSSIVVLMLAIKTSMSITKEMNKKIQEGKELDQKTLEILSEYKEQKQSEGAQNEL